MMKNIHPGLYDLLVLWYGQMRPADTITTLNLLSLWKELWFSKKEKMQENDLKLKKFEGLVDQLHDYKPLGIIDTIGLIILFDQIPRNIFRGKPKAWATDPLAQCLARGLRSNKETYSKLPLHFKLTLCICMLHSECLEDQVENELYIKQLKLQLDEILYSALYQLWYNHWDRVRYFGRIPERNGPLGRQSTTQQLNYLKVMNDFT